MNAQPQITSADQKRLTQLRQSQRLTFERYLDLASNLCGRLASLTPESISDLDRANLIAGSRKEQAALAAYRGSRAALLAYLGI